MSDRHRARSCLALVWASAAGGCLAIEPAASATGERGSIEVRVFDWRGDAWPTDDEIVRRPRIDVRLPRGWRDDVSETGAVVLVRGAVDEALEEDLERAPLRQAHASRAIRAMLSLDGDTVSLTPAAALDAGADYTLAIGAWAAPTDGPDDDVLPASFALRTSTDASAGAAVVGSWPADGSMEVGVDLEAAVVFLDGELAGADTGLWLEGPDRRAVPASVEVTACAVVVDGRAATRCASIAPRAGLAARAPHALRAGLDARDGHGAPIGPWRATFTTASGADRTAPALLGLPCDLDEIPLPWGCALPLEDSVAVRVRASEAVRYSLSAGNTEATHVATRGDARIVLRDLPADAPVTLVLLARDGAGNESRQTHELRTTPPLATLAITEVRANPRGAEPAQEFVEVWNFGLAAIDLHGFLLVDRGDDQGTPIAEHAVVPPAGRALLVPDEFDARDPLDDAPPPGAMLVRIGPALARSGLANAGESLHLRDPTGRRVSAAPATPRPRSGGCTVRTSDDPRDGQDGSFDHAPGDACTPGR